MIVEISEQQKEADGKLFVDYEHTGCYNSDV